MKKLLLTISALFFIQSSFATSNAADEVCGGQSAFSLYECRVQNICETYKSEKPVYNSEDYTAADGATAEFQNNQSNAPALDAAKKLYRENIGNIYKCAIIQSQKNSLNFLRKELGQETSGQLNDTIGGQIDLRISRLELSSNTIGCALTDSQSVQNKLNILRETTTEACKYVNYLEYLKTYYQKTDRFANETEMQGSYGSNVKLQDNFTLGEIPSIIGSVDADIAQEISHTYKILPIAFHAYSEYENNFPIHFLLEIVHADFMILRTRLYETLMPIAQLGLKVINAMSY